MQRDGVYINCGFSRYFANVAVRDEHFKTKRHKKRYVLLHVRFFFFFFVD